MTADCIDLVVLAPIDDCPLAEHECVLEELDTHSFSDDSLVTLTGEQQYPIWEVSLSLFDDAIPEDLPLWSIIPDNSTSPPSFAAFGPATECQDQSLEKTENSRANSSEFLKSLRDLGLGRSSVFFGYDDTTRTFVQKRGPVLRVESFMRETILSFVECGNAVRDVRHFVDLDNGSNVSCLQALKVVASDVLHIFEARLATRCFESLEEAAKTFAAPRGIVSWLKNITTMATFEGSQSNRTILELVHQTKSTSDTLSRAVLAVCLQPWLDAWSACTGLRMSGGGFTRDGDTLDGEDVFLPDFLPQQVKKFLSESEAMLRVLREEQLAHPWSDPAASGIELPGLELAYNLDDIARLEDSAKQYKRAIENALQLLRNRDVDKAIAHTAQADTQDRGRLTTPGSSITTDALNRQLTASIHHLNTLTQATPSRQTRLIQSSLTETLTTPSNLPFTTTPPSSSNPILSTTNLLPLLSTHHALLSYFTLHTALHTLNLHHHLSTLHAHYFLPPFPSDSTRRPPTPRLITKTFFPPTNQSIYTALSARWRAVVHAGAALDALFIPRTRPSRATVNANAQSTRLTLRFRQRATACINDLTTRFWAEGIAGPWAGLMAHVDAAAAATSGDDDVHCGPGRGRDNCTPAGDTATRPPSLADLAAAHDDFLARAERVLLLASADRLGHRARETAAASAAIDDLLACVVAGAERIARVEREGSVADVLGGDGGGVEEEMTWGAELAGMCVGLEGLVGVVEIGVEATGGWGKGNGVGDNDTDEDEDE